MEFFFYYILASIFIIGLIIGSFLNCVIWRFHRQESVFFGRSYCPKCHRQLAWFDLIPVFSYLMLRGRCRYCKKRISWQYPAVELATALFFCFAALAFAPEIFQNYFPANTILALAGYWIVLASLIVIFVADLRWYLIPDGAILSGLTGAAVLLISRLWNFGRFEIGFLADYGLAALFSGLLFLAVFLISRGKWLGFGDVKFVILMGLVLGSARTLVALFFGNFFGAIIGLGLICAKKKKMSSPVPFGPFLVLGTVIAMFFSSRIIDCYLMLYV